MKLGSLKPAILALVWIGCATASFGQGLDLSTPPEPPPAEPVFDPLHAAKSIEVGEFYMKRGNYDAAIDRFQEAAAYQPNLAEPWKLLGEAYEKKRDPTKAIDSYQKYLKIYKDAPDGAKIRQRITTLTPKPETKTAKK